jgi:DnaK suppressor protein
MTSAERAKYQRLLLQLLRQLDGKGQQTLEPNRSTAVDKPDDDAQPLNEMLQAIASNRNQSHAGVKVRVEKALAKLREDPESYGDCEECGEPIARKRLEAMPYAERCVGCQSGQDAPKGPATRRKLTDYR